MNIDEASREFGRELGRTACKDHKVVARTHKILSVVASEGRQQASRDHPKEMERPIRRKDR